MTEVTWGYLAAKVGTYQQPTGGSRFRKHGFKIHKSGKGRYEVEEGLDSHGSFKTRELARQAIRDLKKFRAAYNQFLYPREIQHGSL